MKSIVHLLTRAIPTVVVLGTMVGIGVWGHHSHWTLPSFGAGGGEPKEAAAADGPAEPPRAPSLVDGSDAEPPRVRFESAADVQATGLETAVAERATVDEWVPATAVVEYNTLRVVDLACPVAGRVYAIRKVVGQAVRKGEVLALIDAQEVGRAKADYLQEHLLARYKGDLLAALRATGGGAVPARSLMEAEAGAKEAELRRFTAQQRLLNLGFAVDDLDKVPQTPQELARAIQFLGLPPEVVAELNPRPTSANLFPLIAPFDGVVTRQDVVPGEVVSPNEKAPTEVADVNTMWVKLSVRIEDAAKLDLGQEVEFTSRGLPEPVRGTVTWVSTKIDERTRTIQARCPVDNPVVGRPGHPGDDGLRLLRANLFGAARIRVARHPDSVVVPDAAVQRMPDKTTLVFVALPDGITFEARTVRLGLTRAGRTQLLAGVSPGERVVARGSYVLKSELMKDSLAAE